MKPYPSPDRRQQPRIPGMVVTQPADLDDDQPLHILPHTCNELGVCQGSACTQTCNQGRTCTCTQAASAASQAGSIWYAEPEPPEPMSTADKLGATVLIVISACTAVGLIGWLAGSAMALYGGVL